MVLINMTIQEKTAERIYEILPHKKELGFGCELKHHGYLPVFIYQVRGTGNGSDYKVYTTNDSLVLLSPIVDEKYLRRNSFAKEEMWEIIGQPIRLADILLAIHSMNDINYDYGDFYFNHGNITFRFKDEIYATTAKLEYNLSQDNLLNQSDEFCEMVLGLLGNE